MTDLKRIRSEPAAELLHIPERSLLKVCRDLLTASGINRSQATEAAKSVVWADSVGLSKSGTWQMPMLMNLVCQNLWEADSQPHSAPLNRVGAIIDARHCPGPTAMLTGISQAAAFANLHGMGMAFIKGAAGVGHPMFWSWKIAQMGFASLVFSPLAGASTSDLADHERHGLTFGAPGKGTVHLLGKLETASVTRMRLGGFPPLLPGSEVFSEIIGELIVDGYGATSPDQINHLVILLKPRHADLFRARVQKVADRITLTTPYWAPDAIAARRRASLARGVPLEVAAYIELARLATELDVPFPTANLEIGSFKASQSLH